MSAIADVRCDALDFPNEKSTSVDIHLKSPQRQNRQWGNRSAYFDVLAVVFQVGPVWWRHWLGWGGFFAAVAVSPVTSMDDSSRLIAGADRKCLD